ncbi:hypothetical protein CAI21_18890 [Alkalilimnicola ehrlichii]|uniref:Uncharacterized protein n=1 Tax=Alkalilimnicola ehrlichii TaxID=351052 RepID=A0A3E0WIB0_9GAMM|nr:hypothetical protein [Alkalilimnicola ehrlichii]RFA25591.1 hypothetical protein CAI21_18890 [Alkalilimnicola ehrlichii]RFA32720.1 hypothetical protein CAL65_19155 [Alkalilimnicola ehrlichii]
MNIDNAGKDQGMCPSCEKVPVREGEELCVDCGAALDELKANMPKPWLPLVLAVGMAVLAIVKLLSF